ncbi:negative regulator of systemic acquired resistance SNI1-like isoform X3 [Malus domestica]|uniref:negative regulator of systemic acquired resistance SNI1-like isoform X3 n=1 Tax=Malus domestica TaxID=3750 RepID=UPI0039752C9D
MQKFLVIIMELDVSKQSADTQGSTTRDDSIRFLMNLNGSLRWLFSTCGNLLPSIRTHRSNGPPDDDASFNGALKCFSNITSAKSTIKKIRTEVVQLLLAHGFQSMAFRGHYASEMTQNCLKRP